MKAFPLLAREDGLICAYRFDGRGGAAAIDWADCAGAPDDGAFLWVHLDQKTTQARNWLETGAGLEPAVVEALLASDTRPRCVPLGGGLLLVLRGVNLDAGDDDPRPLVSMQIWAEAGRVISVRRSRILGTADLRDEIAAGRAPHSVGQLLAGIADHMIERLGPHIERLEDEIDAVEEALVLQRGGDFAQRIAELRRDVIPLRRFVAPQRDAVLRLAATEAIPFARPEREALSGVAETVVHHIDSLDSLRERTAVLQDEQTARLTQRLNRSFYILSVVATIFLPLTLLAGMLGANVGGIPGGDSPRGFLGLCAFTLALAAGELWLLRRLGWL